MTFNPQAFLNQTIHAPMATQITPCPVGDWIAQISTKIPVEEWFDEATWKDKKTGQEKSQPTCKVPVEIIDSRAKELLPRENIILNYDMFLDVDAHGHLDTGEDKNVRLGALREALGQNEDTSWVFSKLFGAGPFVAKVVHTVDEKRDGQTFAKITRVAKLK